MEKYIIGKFKKIIYENKESNFVVTLFKVEDTDDTFIKKKYGQFNSCNRHFT